MIRILYVEDEEMLHDLLSEFVSTSHPQIEVICIASPLAAIAMIEEQQRFDVIITDCDMPEASGFDVIDACIEHGFKQVIMLSGIKSNLHEAEQRFNGYINLQTITKPIPLMKLGEMIEQATSTSQQEQVT